MSTFIEGFYKATDTWMPFIKVENGIISCKDPAGTDYPIKSEYGDFGSAPPEIQEKTGVDTYNVRLTFTFPQKEGEETPEFLEHGVLYAAGTKCMTKGMMGFAHYETITEEEAIALENEGEPIDAPPGPYKIQPEKQGKIIWLSGAPGLGKSTSAQMLGRDHGYVYYEADCFASMKNPYIPLDVDNPSMAQIKQKNLKGPGDEARKEILTKSQEMWMDLMSGKDFNREIMENYYAAMAEDIGSEKKRIGGDWAIAHVILTKHIRQKMREWLGQDLIFVHLEMSAEDRRARVLGRHKGETQAADLMDVFTASMEAVEDDEPNTIVLNVTKEMSRDDVLAEILRRIEEVKTKEGPAVTRLLDGYYKCDSHYCQTYKIDGDNSTGKDGTDTEHALIIKYGDFGPAHEKVVELTGEARYGIKIVMDWGAGTDFELKTEDGETKKIEMSELGVIREEGRKLVLKGAGGVATFEKITEEELIALENDFDDIEAPPGPHKVQPENQGRIIWLSGAPGMGKSTSAQILGRNHGYVYYEADCFANLKNPFIPLDEADPSMAQMKQRKLKGPGREARLKVMKESMTCWGQMMSGQEYDKAAVAAYYTAIAEDIKAQKERIGGDWAVAHVVIKKEHRDAIKESLGSQLHIVNLVMSTEDRRKRIIERHMGDENIGDVMDLFERLMDPTEEEEENTTKVQVSAEMTREEVVQKILQVVGGGKKSDVSEKKKKTKSGKQCNVI